MPMSYTYVNDKFVPSSEAVISVDDRGFRFGDGLFETIAVFGGVPYQWELHMLRLEAGLRAFNMPFDQSILRPLCVRLLSQNKITDGFLRIAISRGSGSRGYLPLRRDRQQPTLVIEASPRPNAERVPSNLWLSNFRKPPPECLPVHTKMAQGLNSTMARMEARERGCFEALQLTIDDYICEGSSCNIFWFMNGVLYTPSTSCGLLNGTTRLALIRLSPYPVEQGEYELNVLRDAEEVFVTNSAWQVKSVQSLQPMGLSWERFHVADEMQMLLEQDIAEYVASH